MAGSFLSRRLLRFLPDQSKNTSNNDVSRRHAWRSEVGVRLIVPLCMLIGVIIWQLAVPASGAVSLLLPRPSAILGRFASVVTDGELFGDIGTTAIEIGLGFLLGVGVAFLLGYAIARNHTLEKMTGPYIVAFQALPIVALAPALILWLGPGVMSNSIICAFIVFFPMLVSTITGMKGIERDQLTLMRSFAANTWQTFRWLELPASLPTLFGGLRISVTLAVAGAVVAESVTPVGGLGSLLYEARSQYDSPLAFVSVISLIAFTLILYGAVTLLERHVLIGRNVRRSPLNSDLR